NSRLYPSGKINQVERGRKSPCQWPKPLQNAENASVNGVLQHSRFSLAIEIAGGRSITAKTTLHSQHPVTPPEAAFERNPFHQKRKLLTLFTATAIAEKVQRVPGEFPYCYQVFTAFSLNRFSASVFG